jgi:3-hexulose-6-phosphate synthase/6-phospho-3-hexuloisomerase
MFATVQISLDVLSIDEALSTAEMALRAGVDWLEAGTPLIIAEGMHGVRALRERFPQTPIVADLKTMDGGYLDRPVYPYGRLAKPEIIGYQARTQVI